jgi:D-3-phosphoglycerate dehydrogenase
MKPIVVIAYSGFGDLDVEKQVLRAIDAEIIHAGNLTSPQALAAVTQADALMVTLEKVTAEIITSMTRCKVISRAGTGLDSIDIAAATAQGIWVAYVPDYSIDEVSTHAIALLLAQARGIAPLIQSTRNGQWNSQLSGPVYRLKGRMLGVVGFGRIGQATAEKGKGLGLNVLVHDPYLDTAAVARIGHFVNAGFLALMKPTAYLINAARGPLIDEDALLQAVRVGQIAGAALDVLTIEPPPPDHPLLHEERVLITPHSAWYSEEAKIDLRTRCAEEVVRVLSGQTPRAPVNKIKDMNQ